MGDACDDDIDDDGVPNHRDNCPAVGDLGSGIDRKGCPII
jgi:hypothetical protein